MLYDHEKVAFSEYVAVVVPELVPQPSKCQPVNLKPQSLRVTEADEVLVVDEEQPRYCAPGPEVDVFPVTLFEAELGLFP